MFHIFKSVYFTLLLLFFATTLHSQVGVVSWNVQNFGKSKTTEQISFIANTVKDFDIVALQEVVSGPGGAQAVARLDNELDRTGTNWDYVVSNTSQPGNTESERYAFLWKTSAVKMHQSWLESKFAYEISREPFFCTFLYKGKSFTLSSLHAVPKKKQPETEIKYLKYFAEAHADKNVIFLGDFNLPQSHTVFNPIRKLGWKPAFTLQKTTLKMICTQGNCLASEYDNIWLPKNVNLLDCGVILFYEKFEDNKAARKLSDHIPIFVRLQFN
jgi:hypothetical protein